MQRIINYIKDYQIVGLGEATHGQLKITLLRIKIFKILCQKYGFNVFVLEEQYSCCNLLDKYIKGTINTNLHELMSKLMIIYRTKEMYNLIQFMKKYNMLHTNKLSILGVDIQHQCYKPITNIDKYVDSLNKKFYKNKKMRDPYMFRVFDKCYRNTNKYVLYGHAGHIGCFEIYGKPSLGCLLYENYDYVSIGNTFFKGRYIGKNFESKKYEIAKINEPIEIKSGFLILSPKRYNMYFGGFSVDKNNPLKYFDKEKIDDSNFDAVIVLNNELPLKYDF